MKNDVEASFNNNLLLVEPDKTYTVGDIKFETFSSYNLSKKYHPKENMWVGYTLRLENQKVTIVGDSDATKELKNIKTDILLIPIGGEYTMNLFEAAEVTNSINPKKVIPTHYGEIVGNNMMGNEFKKLIANNIDCELQI